MIFPSRQSPWILAVCLLAGALSGFGGEARAQRLRSDDSLDVPVAPFRITEWSGETGIQIDSFGESQKLDGGQRIDFKNQSFQEYLLYRMRGYVYHPRFLDINGDIKLGLLQQQLSQTGGSGNGFDGGSRSTFLDGYDLYLRFFQEHPFSFSLFAQHDRSAVLDLYTDRILLDQQTWGASANWKAGAFPMSASYTDSRINETGFDSRSETTNRVFEYSVRNNIGQWMQSELRYRLQDYTQNFRTDSRLFSLRRKTDLKTNEVSFNNIIFLDPARRSSLTSFVRYYDQSGSQNLKNMNWQERLFVRHTPKLSSYYLLSYLVNEVDQSTVKTWRGEMGLDHHLYQSLDEHVDYHYRTTDFGELTDTEYGVTARLNYRKETPWGRLLAGYGTTIDQIKRSGQGGSAHIVNEALTLDPNVTQFLSQPEVDRSSIAVTDAAGLAPFAENIDYEIETRGNRTGLRLLPGGGITPGQQVLVSYDITISSDLSYVTMEQDLNLRYEFSRYLTGLALYYRWRELTPSGASSGTDASILSFDDQLIGMQYDWRMMTLTEEFETYRSNFSDYNEWTSRLEGHHTFDDQVKWTWSVGMLLTNYLNEKTDGESDRDRMIYAGTSLGGKIRDSGYWEIEARLNRESGRTDETFAGLLAKVGWHIRKVRIEGGARFDMRDRFDSKLDRYHVFLQIAREF